MEKSTSASPRTFPAEGGISIIYQELSVVNWLDIRENIFMGRLPMKKVGPLSVVNYAEMDKRTKELLEKVNLGHRKPHHPGERAEHQ